MASTPLPAMKWLVMFVPSRFARLIAFRLLVQKSRSTVALTVKVDVAVAVPPSVRTSKTVNV